MILPLGVYCCFTRTTLFIYQQLNMLIPLSLRLSNAKFCFSTLSGYRIVTGGENEMNFHKRVGRLSTYCRDDAETPSQLPF